MFSRNEVSIGAWLLFYILIAIPFVNIIVYLILLFGKNTNKTLRNMLWAMTLPLLIVFILYVMGFSALPF